MSFIAFMMSAGRIINAVTEFLSGFIIDQTHTLSLCKYDAQAANNGITQSSVTLFAERCGYAVVPLVCSILLVLITINEQIQNIAQKKDTLCRRMYN